MLDVGRDGTLNRYIAYEHAVVGIANRTYSTTSPKRHTKDCIGNVFCHESTKDRSGRGMGR